MRDFGTMAPAQFEPSSGEMGGNLLEFLDSTKASPSFCSESDALRKRCIEDIRGAFCGLRSVVCEIGAVWRVEPFGSSVSGFASDGSDLDITCWLESSCSLEQQVLPGHEAYKTLALKLLQQLGPLLEARDVFTEVEVIGGASVPVLRVVYAGKVDVDLSWNNLPALRNTRLLRAYADLDPKVRCFTIAVKRWAKATGLCGAVSKHLSSYSLTLMALYFMQVHPEIRLSCFPVASFQGSPDSPSKMHAEWTTAMPPALMMIEFFRFYAFEFAWGSEVVSLRLGRRFLGTPGSRNCNYCELSGRLSDRLHIEDPFIRWRNLNCVLGTEQETHLRENLRNVASAFDHQASHVAFRNSLRDSLAILSVGNRTNHVGARANVELCCYPEHKEMLGKSALDLVALLEQSNGLEGKRSAAKAIAHLCYRHPANQQSIGDYEPVIPALVQLLEDGDEAGKQSAAQALANLCYKDAAHMKRVGHDERAVSAFVQLLERGDAPGKRWAMRAIITLCALPANRDRIGANHCAVAGVVAQLEQGDGGGKAQAAHAIASLCQNHQENQTAVAKDERTVPALVLMLENGDAAGKHLAAQATQQAARAISSLCLDHPVNRKRLREDARATAALARLMGGGAGDAGSKHEAEAAATALYENDAFQILAWPPQPPGQWRRQLMRPRRAIRKRCGGHTARA